MSKNLGIIHLGAFGDIVATFSAICRLKSAFGNIHLFCRDQIGKLAVALGLVQKSFPLEAAVFASLYDGPVDHRLKQILRCYDEILLFSYSESLQERIAQTVKRKIHRIPPRPGANLRRHVTSHLFEGLIRAGLLQEAPAGLPFFISKIIDKSGGDSRFDSKTVLIHPGSGSREKCWPMANFFKLEKCLRSRGLKPEFIIGPAEAWLKKKLTRPDHHQRPIHMLFDLTELAVRLTCAGGFIGNDSGVSHLAAFLGLPTVTLFGPSDPERWCPVGEAVRVVRPDLDCSPCFETKERVCKEKKCLALTTPESAMDAFFQVYGKAPRSMLADSCKTARIS